MTVAVIDSIKYKGEGARGKIKNAIKDWKTGGRGGKEGYLDIIIMSK